MIKRIFKKYNITPIALLQGNPKYDITGNVINKRKKYQNATVLFDGLYNNKKVIVKIFLKLKSTYLREVYCYKNLSEQNSYIKQFFPELYLYNDQKLPFVVIGKIPGQTAGEWYRLDNITQSNIIRIIDFACYINKNITIPKQISFSTHENINKFGLLHRDIKKLLVYNKNFKDYWSQYLIYYKKLKKILVSCDKGFTFGDFSPSNIIIDNKGTIKFIDMEAISNNHITLDMSLFYYSSLHNPVLSKRLYQCLSDKLKFNDVPNNEKLFRLFLSWFILKRFINLPQQFKVKCKRELQQNLYWLENHA